MIDKKKVAIVTLTGANYGNRLQNLATQMILEKMGYDVETLHNPFDPNYSELKHQMKNKFKMLIAKKSINRKCVEKEHLINLMCGLLNILNTG
ncbi:polysaccharide pyruvyl transferase family protein [Acetobacterium wieringae]|uniref:polysaccharide pyruvyl transferase family protein n=1 Tax=Acetobacterium wieringae TaxID=52694 RepID=UPI002033F8E6|nr:polysaccharide pyruvyl transferase family protein [Acetobacterium wieringae]URN84113.1 polysaccharide pyruvyl transferase family protein [Acetobacterium wieringae]